MMDAQLYVTNNKLRIYFSFEYFSTQYFACCRDAGFVSKPKTELHSYLEKVTVSDVFEICKI